MEVAEDEGVDDASANLAAMQTTVDPSGGSLATALRGEIQRLRFQIKAGFGLTNWYDTISDYTITTAGSGIIFKSPDGTKTFRGYVDNNGEWTILELT